MKIPYAAALFFVLILTGCAGAPQVEPIPPQDAQNGVATLHVYRLRTAPYLQSPDIKINGFFVAELPTNSCFSILVPVGNHKVSSHWFFLDAPILNRSANITVEANKQYFIQFVGKFMATPLAPLYAPGITFLQLAEAPPDYGGCTPVPSRAYGVNSK